MKLWKENKTNKEYDLDTADLARRFLASGFYGHGHDTARELVDFLTSPDGLNSIWEWDKQKGSIDGNPDMARILDYIDDPRTLPPPENTT